MMNEQDCPGKGSNPICPSWGQVLLAALLGRRAGNTRRNAVFLARKWRAGSSLTSASDASEPLRRAAGIGRAEWGLCAPCSGLLVMAAASLVHRRGRLGEEGRAYD
jgi:hypothetical protein